MKAKIKIYDSCFECFEFFSEDILCTKNIQISADLKWNYLTLFTVFTVFSKWLSNSQQRINTLFQYVRIV